ncbi:disease resistance protein RPP13-like [Rhododendron vialii]|uniref:disease resistance protein RPP13-like n=1 Tax=Rhododendron vialii TaxID=182163 RepID=UPI00265F4966|nr:disease resistance protein RPP13-like [Rhododendron vialii]
MVDAIVSFVVGRLGDLLAEQVVFLREVEDDVKWLKDNLEHMLCFLKNAEEKPDVDNRMRKWISDIRDVAYEAEDIIDNFILKVEAETPKKIELEDYFQKYFCIYSKNASLIQQENLYGIGHEINTLKTKLNQIKQSRVTFDRIRSIDDARDLGSCSMNAREGLPRMNTIDNWLRRERSYKDDENVVGFKEDVDKLMSELVKELKDRYVISIVGTGGLGKTTIAQKLYNTLSSTKKFDCYGWVSVSTDYNIQDLLRSAIKSFKKPDTKEELVFLEKMKEEDLEPHLHNYLKGSRYLVVLDDVWDGNAWPSLMRAFPNENNGSRVIMTTRNKVVAELSYERTYVHELTFLNDEESWELFCCKAFPTYDVVGNQKSHCPPHLENLAREMAGKCRGLPLAIVVLGALLRRKDPDEWPKLKEHMWRHIRDHGSDRVQHILALSFNNLPYRLKSCFLYLGLFPEDFEIDVKKLCWLWEAEGFIKLDKESDEEKAEAYLRELIDRSLIQVEERNWRRIITCRVHDLLRDFAIEKSKELNFLHIYEETLAPNSRRLASYCGLKRFVSLDHSYMRLRTLLFFSLENRDLEIAHLQPLCRNLRLLRVLDIGFNKPDPSEETLVRKKKRLPDEIGKLIHLRYLGIRGTNINVLSQFMGNLHALQTLELNYDVPIQLPDEICKAKQLRHLIGRFKWPFRVDNLTNLRTLRTVFVKDQMEFDPMNLINLCELHVTYVVEGNNRITLDSIGGLRRLQSLHIEVSKVGPGRNPEVDLHPLSHCRLLLQLRLLLGIRGRYPINWKLPTEVLPNLQYLFINASGLTEDPMPMLEKLPKLTVLWLGNYCENKFVCTTGGFPQLQILHLISNFLEEIQVEEGGMPVLKGLFLDGSDEISMPDRLRSIPAPEPPLNWTEWGY